LRKGGKRIDLQEFNSASFTHGERKKRKGLHPFQCRGKRSSLSQLLRRVRFQKKRAPTSETRQGKRDLSRESPGTGEKGRVFWGKKSQEAWGGLSLSWVGGPQKRGERGGKERGPGKVLFNSDPPERKKKKNWGTGSRPACPDASPAPRKKGKGGRTTEGKKKREGGFYLLSKVASERRRKKKVGWQRITSGLRRKGKKENIGPLKGEKKKKREPREPDISLARGRRESCRQAPAFVWKETGTEKKKKKKSGWT